MKKILLVEDNESLAENLNDLFHNLGFAVRLATNGREALHALVDYRPDLIITDVVMPLMDGLELTIIIRKNHSNRDIPIIVMSAKTTPEDRQAGLDAGANAYLKKPCSVEEIIDAIDKLLNP
jgi:CheY-like chemotaxis protein